MAGTSSLEDLASFSDAEADSDVESDGSDEATKILGDMLGELETLQMELGEEQGYSQSLKSAEPSDLRDRSSAPGKAADGRRAEPPLETYRKSKSHDDSALDLDELLGELCMLENVLSRNSVLDLSKLSCDDTPPLAAAPPPPRKPAAEPQQQHDPAGHAASNATREAPPAGSPPPPATDDADNDSAFCDYESLPSSESCTSTAQRDEPIATATTTTTTTTPAALPLSDEEVKAQRIRVALDKIREANVRKLYVKVFAVDGSTKSLLVDERQCAGEVCAILADKFHVPLTPRWCLVEVLPPLHVERTYEDHESVVRNLVRWPRSAAATHRLVFAERDDKYDLFANPQRYLLTASSSELGREMSDAKKRRLVEEFFGGSGGEPRVPDADGTLHLKVDGKKAWKRHHFVLRASGLYYVPKGKANNLKHLVCLAKLDSLDVYGSLDWRKKYRAPTEFGFALKHPQIMKAGKHVKYLCADDERARARWMMAIRVAKFGRQLHDNWQRLQRTIASDAAEAWSGGDGGSTFLPSLNGSSSSGSLPGINVVGLR
ncbi:PREDICTED: amyloid beta A4 precursor protein-binding family B member 1-interacting protein-like [Priapulus caudatus]|uniref:Amyloid beta A4 precursor protein-binding family B member 1-interacting protein-like n=1 Tax=Priapulus caudatus TaxID=37621 RepID=A0ABM1FAA0_PRICU|nr:PREDICTED: amyloid beta A4 precursor protein-binding family B member 1-interacting protein-like [Priapulus caudatus]